MKPPEVRVMGVKEVPLRQASAKEPTEGLGQVIRLVDGSASTEVPGGMSSAYFRD